MNSPSQTSCDQRPVQLALLDASRGAAALWVVLVHATVAHVANEHRELLDNPFYAFAVRGQIGVGFFFAISGYCILATIFNALLRGGTIRQYFAARFRRIYPPYLIALGCAVLLNLSILFLISKGVFAGARPPDSPLDHNSAYWLTNLALLQLPAGYGNFLFVSWSLCFEIAFYVIAGAIWAVCSLGGRRSASPALLVTMLNLCSLISVAWAALSPGSCPFPLDRWYQFGLGIAMFVLINRRPLKLGLALQVQSVLVILAVLAHACTAPSSIPAWRFYSEQTLVLSVLGFVITIIAASRFDRQITSHWLMSPFRKLGRISYSLYLIHMLPMPLVDTLLRRAGLSGQLYILNAAAQVLVALVAGTVFFHFVERRFFEPRKRTPASVPLQSQITT